MRGKSIFFFYSLTNTRIMLEWFPKHLITLNSELKVIVKQTAVIYREGIEMPSRAPLLARADNKSSGFPFSNDAWELIFEFVLLELIIVSRFYRDYRF